MLEQLSPKTFGQLHSTFPPALSFQQAEQILDRLPKPFFLWVHVFAPHFPYLPEPPYLHRFLQTDELRTHAEFADMFDLTGFSYSPAKQPLVDKGRLRYDEWIAQADGAFGQFIENLRSSGRLDDMAIVVSADHGESFSGGFLGHGGSQQLRPVVHVPLLLHLPGQTDGHEIASCVDHTVLAPTMLEIAGIARPGWMDGESLSPLLHGGQELSASLAYTQFFVANSAFKPITHGTVGVIDGQHQYVFNLDTRVGALFDLAEAHEQKLDRSLAEPGLVKHLRDQIGRRFPGLIG
jgi:arylsulfatase A-like enzyme